MKIIRLNLFKKDYQGLPKEIKKQADKQLKFLIANSRHPSLRTKKIEGREDIWEGRITRSYRFTFQMIKDTYILRRIGQHEEVLRKP